MNVLLIEDDPILARGLTVNLELEGYQVVWVQDLKSAYAKNDSEKFGLAILDLGLPDGSGFEFLKKARTNGSRLPIVILSANAHEDSVVDGLQYGANDYMKKPFSNKELIARIKTVLKEPQTREEQIRFGDLLILLESRTVKFQDRPIEVNRREFDVLLYLVEHAEKIVSREALVAQLDRSGEIFDRTIDSHVSHVRARLKKADVTAIKISSVYGVGYRLEKA